AMLNAWNPVPLMLVSIIATCFTAKAPVPGPWSHRQTSIRELCRVDRRMSISARQGIRTGVLTARLTSMTREEQAALVAWLRRPEVVWSTVTDQLEEYGRVRVAVAAGAPAQGALFDTGEQDDAEAAVADLEQWELAGIRMVSVLDAEYPSNLRMIHQRPPVLF